MSETITGSPVGDNTRDSQNSSFETSQGLKTSKKVEKHVDQTENTGKVPWSM